MSGASICLWERVQTHLSNLITEHTGDMKALKDSLEIWLKKIFVIAILIELWTPGYKVSDFEQF